ATAPTVPGDGAGKVRDMNDTRPKSEQHARWVATGRTGRRGRPSSAQRRALAAIEARPTTPAELQALLEGLSGRLRVPLEGVDDSQREQLARALLALAS